MTFEDIHLSRRTLLGMAGLSLAGGLLAACGGSEESSSGDQESESTSATTPEAESSTPAESSSRKDLRVTLPAEPGFMNPVMVTGDRNFSKVSWQVFDSLLAYDYSAGKLVPQLAESWTQKDPHTWEFKLREGVQFHRGYGEMTADDVEFMVNYVVENDKPLKFLYFFVESAKATGKYTVEYKLSEPFAPFLLTTVRDRGAMIVSKKAYEEMGEEAFNRNPVGTGPFEFESWKSGQEITLTRFADYWQAPLPRLDSITYSIVGDSITRESLLHTGEVDFIDAPDYKNVADWRDDDDYVVTSVPAWGTDWIPFSVGVPPFDSKELRQAISYAIDREALVKNVYYGEAQADQGPLPEGYLGYPSPAVYPLTGDQAKAKELMAQAGVPDGFDATVLTTAQFKTLAEVIAGQLSEIDIQVTVEVVDPGTQSARTRAREFEMNAGNLGFMTPDSDSTMYWFYHTDTVGNYGYNNPEVDGMLEEARITDDPQQRADMYQSILEIVLGDAPYAYLLHPNIVRIYKKGLEGIQEYPQDHVLIFRDAFWSE